MKKNTIALISLLLCLVLIVPGCQETPKEQVVVEKSENYLEQAKTKESATPSPSEVVDNEEQIETYQSKFISESGKFEVLVNAEKNYKATNDFEIIQMEPSHFEENNIVQLINGLFKEQDIYEDTTMVHTKKEIEEEIVLLKENADQYVNPDDAIAFLEQQYQDAPEDFVFNKINVEDIDLSTDHFGIMGERNKGDYVPPYLRVQYSEDNRSDKLEYVNFGDRNNYEILYSLEGQPRNTSINRDEAVDISTKFLNELGLENMILSGEYETNIFDPSNFSAEYLESKEYNEKTDQCFVFHFSRNYKGIPVNDVLKHPNDTAFETGEKAYINPFNPEIFEVAVNDRGIIKFKWSNPLKQVEIIKENIEIMDFSDIMKTFEKQMKIESPKYDNDGYISKYIININEIRLGYAPIATSDNYDVCNLVPVVDFLGTDQYISSDGTVDEAISTSTPSYSLLTINAIDGSVINRGVGY